MNEPWVVTTNYTRRFLASGVVHLVSVRKQGSYPKNMTFCRVPSWRLGGRWVPPDTQVTCLGCLGEMT